MSLNVLDIQTDNAEKTRVTLSLTAGKIDRRESTDWLRRRWTDSINGCV